MKRRVRFTLLIVSAFCMFVWLNNTSIFSRGGDPVFIAHRGVAPEMHPEHEDYFQCLARVHPATHSFIENTIPSIKAAFDLGASYVEIDVRSTADENFAVFHDDVLDCKTESTGRLVDRSMAELRELDVGYGYFTADGKYPLRGKGIGLMPSLQEVLDKFPFQHFVINIKNDDMREAERLAYFLGARGSADIDRLLVFGGPSAVKAIRKVRPTIRAASRESAKTCIRDYMIVGWTGYVPSSCRHTATGMFANYAWVLWGWPHRFVDRMQSVDTIVILTHPYQDESIHSLPETQEYAEMIPLDYGGAVNTNRIDKIREWFAEAHH